MTEPTCGSQISGRLLASYSSWTQTAPSSKTVTVDNGPEFPVFDGTNIWVPNFLSNTVTVVRASRGAVLATLMGNGWNGPEIAAFDGERILVTNSVSLWKAADLSPLGSVSTGASSIPIGACSDGLNFWVTLAVTSPDWLLTFVA